MLVWVLVGVEVEAEVGCLVVVGAHLVADTAVPAAVDKAVHQAVEMLAVVVHTGSVHPPAWDVLEGGDILGQFLVQLV